MRGFALCDQVISSLTPGNKCSCNLVFLASQEMCKMLMPGKIRHKHSKSAQNCWLCAASGIRIPLNALQRGGVCWELPGMLLWHLLWMPLIPVHFSSHFSRRKQRRALSLRLHERTRALPKGWFCQHQELCGMSSSQGRGPESVLNKLLAY